MWLIYLLLMLDNITILFTTVGVISATAWVILVILSIVGEASINDRYSDWSEKGVALVKRIRNTMLKIFIPFLTLGVFLPNSKQAAVIFSVGQTIEYVKGNEKLKELPDKTVMCLDKFISEYLEEEPVSNDTCN
jgi:hypothetical protein